jgi:hypothetical protein
MNTRIDETSLAGAATEFETELARYEKITSELRRTPVTSEKTLQRTRRLLGECAECEQQLSVLLQQLLQAMNRARDRQQTCMQHSLDAASSLQSRANEFQELLERVAKLGQLARDVNEPVSIVNTSKEEGASTERMLAALNEVGARIDGTLREADSISAAATDGDWPEIAREVKNLKQQMQAARGRVMEAAQRMVSQN